MADYAPGGEIGLGFLFGNSLIPKGKRDMNVTTLVSWIIHIPYIPLPNTYIIYIWISSQKLLAVESTSASLNSALSSTTSARWWVTICWSSDDLCHCYLNFVQENIRRRSKNKTSARALEHFTIRQDDWVKKFNLFPQEIMRLGENCSTSGNCSARGRNEKTILKKTEIFHLMFPKVSPR